MPLSRTEDAGLSICPENSIGCNIAGPANDDPDASSAQSSARVEPPAASNGKSLSTQTVTGVVGIIAIILVAILAISAIVCGRGSKGCKCIPPKKRLRSRTKKNGSTAVHPATDDGAQELPAFASSSHPSFEGKCAV